MVLKKRKKLEMDEEEINNGMDVENNDNIDNRNEFKVLKYQLNDTNNTAIRHLFLKSEQQSQSSNSISLSVLNIPPFISVESIKSLIQYSIAKEYPIKDISLKRSMIKNADPNETYRVMNITFNDENDVENALKNCEKLTDDIICLSSIGIQPSLFTISRYVEEYNDSLMTTDEIDQKLDTFFKQYDLKVIEEKAKAKRMHNVADADGWITVTHSRFKPAPPAVVVKSKEDLLKLSKHKKQKDTIPFYTFQMKQSKIKHLEELKEKFEEDKKKLAIAKAARKFRPT